MTGINPRVRQQRLADFHTRRRIPIEMMPPKEGPSALRAVFWAVALTGFVALVVELAKGLGR